MAELYDEGYFVDGGGRAGYVDYEAEATQHRRTARARLDRVSKAMGVDQNQPVRLVDVGTAVGFLPDEAQRRGWNVAAVEVSGWARERSRRRGIRTEESLEALADLRGQVDVVTFFQVLEHIPDPIEALRLAHDLLRPGGIVVCETWDRQSRTARLSGSRWQQLSPPSVLWLFNPSSVQRMITTTGFEPVTWRRTPKAVSLATVLGQAFSGMPAPVLRAVAPVATHIPVPYPLDDLVTFVARRSMTEDVRSS